MSDFLPFEVRSDAGALIAAFRQKRDAETFANEHGLMNMARGGGPVVLVELDMTVLSRSVHPL